MDYFATYGQRSVALELKRITTSTIANANEWHVLKHHWQSVKLQAQSALAHLRSQRYLYAVSLGLLVIRIHRAAFPKQGIDVALEKASEMLEPVTRSVDRHLRPHFLALYKPPSEMQVIHGWGSAGDRSKVFPGVVFAATVQVRRDASR